MPQTVKQGLQPVWHVAVRVKQRIGRSVLTGTIRAIELHLKLAKDVMDSQEGRVALIGGHPFVHEVEHDVAGRVAGILVVDASDVPWS